MLPECANDALNILIHDPRKACAYNNYLILFLPVFDISIELFLVFVSQVTNLMHVTSSCDAHTLRHLYIIIIVVVTFFSARMEAFSFYRPQRMK